MKIEMDENTQCVSIIALITVGLFSIVLVCCHYYTKRVETAMQNGYVESTVAGTSTLVWTKK